MAVKDINDLYQQLSADENFSGLFSSPEEFADTMQNMSSERQQAFYDKLVSGTQISNVDFTNALKKKEEANSTFESLSVGSKPNEPVEKVVIQTPEPQPEGLASQGIDLGLEAPADLGYGKGVPIPPKDKIKNSIIGIINGMNSDPQGNWGAQYQALMKDPEFQKYKLSGDIQLEVANITKEWERLSKSNYDLKQRGEQIGLVPKVETVVPPAPKSVVLKKPETLYGRAYADAVAAEKRKKDQLSQNAEPLYIQSDNTVVNTLDPSKIVEADAFAQTQIKNVKKDPSTLYNAIEGKKLKYYTPQGQEIPFDEFALGSLLFNQTRLELQDANGPVDITNLGAGGNRKEGMSFLDENSFRKILVQNGFPEYKIDEEVERLKTNYLQQQAASEIKQNQNRFLSESGGNRDVANYRFLNDYNEKGRELLSDDEQEAYAIVKQIETLMGLVDNARKSGGGLTSGTIKGFDILAAGKKIKTLQAQLGALRDNPNNLYDWKTGEFIDTRIATNKPKVEQIKAENAEFQVKYANTPKGDLTRMRNTLIAQREVIARKMTEDGIEVPEAGTFGSFVSKLQTSAARTGGNYSITLPNGLTMNSAQYEKKVAEYQKQLFEVEKNLYGINRSLMLNENVLLRKETEGFIESIVPSLGTAIQSVGREFIPGASEGDAKADWEIRNSLLMLAENGYVISPELKSLARKSVGEQIFDSAGMLASAMVQISMGNIAIPEITAMKWAKGMSNAMKTKYGRVGEMVFENTAGAIRQGSIFQVAGQGFATGVGESLGQMAYDAMKLDRLFVNKGRLLPYLTRSILGGTAETIQEYAGQYLQVVSENGIDAEGNFKKTFGHDIETALDQLMVIGITSVSFSGAANLKILTATSSTLQNILENPKAAAAYGDIIDADKKAEIEEVLRVVNDKINDRTSQKLNSDGTKEKSDVYEAPLDAETRTTEIAALEESRKEALQKVYDTNTANTEEEKQNINEQVDAINQSYDDQINSLLPKSTKFDSLTGRNLSAVVAGSDLNAPHVIEFLSNIPSERNRKAAAEMIAISQKANNTLRSVLPEATIVIHDKKSFADKMEQRGITDSRKANFSIKKRSDGSVDIEIQINAEDGGFVDIAHEVTHGLLFNKFYDNEGRTKEINEAKDSILGSPKELEQKIAEINDKYDTQFSETLGEFKKGLEKIASESQSKYLSGFLEGYDENSKSEEFIVEFTAILAENGEKIQQEDPTLFQRLLALLNKLVDKIGSQAGIKLQKFKDTQEIIDFMNNVTTALREGKAVEGVKTTQKAGKVTEEVNLEDKARKEAEYKVVYHGGNIKGPQNNLYVATDENQAKAYAKGNQGQVSNFTVNVKTLAQEDVVRKTIEEMGLRPKDANYVAEDLNLHELIDNRFESALPDNEIEALKNKLKEEGYTGISFKDEDMLGKTKLGVDNFFIFEKKDLLEKAPEPKVKKEKITNIFKDENGNPRSIYSLAKPEEERLPLIAESEGIGSLGKTAANIARKFSEGKPENEVETKLESKKLKAWAKKNNVYVEDFRDIFSFELTEYEQGSESFVFAGSESRYVYKVTNGGPWATTWTEFFQRIAAHNLLFPDTRYEVVGFTESDIDFGVILKQPLIDYLDGVSDQKVVKEEMLKRGYTEGKKSGQWINEEEGIILSDLHEGNVIYGPSGIIQFIDPYIEFLPNSKMLSEINRDFDGENAVTRLEEQRKAANLPLVERTPINLSQDEEKAVYDILDDFNGNQYEQENLNVGGSYSVPPKSSGRFLDKARIDYTKDFEIDGIQMRAVKYISPINSRNKKYNATMSDHTKVGSYANPRTGTVVDNLYGGFLFSYIAENFDNEVVWASTTASKARELIMNSKGQDQTVIYRMNRKTGSNGNDNFSTIAIKEFFAPVERGLVSEQEMLDIVNKRMSEISLGKVVMSQGYSTGDVIGESSIVKKGETKELTMKAFVSIEEFKQAFLGGGTMEKLPFATRGPLWSSLLIEDADVKPNKDYFKQLEKWGVPRISEIVDLIAEPVTDAAKDSDIIAALKINAPEMVEIIENGKKKKVAKVWTPFKELVDEEKGIYFTKGVRHTSYPYVVKGAPLGAFEEFHSVVDYFPVIKDWLERTKESEGFLSRQEVMEKNAEQIRTAQMNLEQAKNAYDQIAKSKDVPKEVKESLREQLKEYEKEFNKATRFEPRLSSSYKAIETMHGELMRNFDSTAKLIPTDRRPLRNGVLPMEDKGRIEPWSTPQQEITSAGTSINKAKLPGVYSDKAFFNILRNTPGDKITIVDVGSGKYANMNIKPLLERGEVSDLITEGSQIKLKETAVPTIQEIIASKEIVYLPYDPFNQPASVNESTVAQVRGGKANIGISPNVLNVIAEAEAREGVIANLADAVGDTGVAIIQIYEGDPKDKGNGKVTKTGGEQSWQNNQPTSWYIPEVKKYFANVKFANKIIIADNKGFEDKGRISEKALEAKQYGIPQRYKGDVGKFIGGDLYVHKSAMDVLPQKEMEMAESMLPEGFEYEIVKYNAAQGSFSFISSPDWNTSPEPIVGDAYKVSRNGDVSVTKQKADPQIYHHKWNFVRDDYDGFNVRQSIQRSIDWYRDAKADINMFKIGTQSYWNQNAVPLINNTILNLQDKARKQDDIQQDYINYKKKDPFATPNELGNKLLMKGYSLGEIKRFVPELSEFYQREAVNKFARAIRSTQGKIRKRQDAIRQELAKNSSLSYTSMYDLLRKDYQDFELYKAFYEEGGDPQELDEIFGVGYRETIQKAMNQTQDGKSVYSPDLLREIREDARARKMVGVADQMKEVFTGLNDIVSAEAIINLAADSLEEGFIEAAMQEVTDDMRRRRQEMKDNVEILTKISKGDLKPGTVIDVSKLLSIAGRILQTGRGLTETQEGLEKLIFNSLEIVEYRPGQNVIRKQRVFKLTDYQKEKLRKAIKEYKKSSDAFKAATKALEEGPDMYTDAAFAEFDKAKSEFEKQARQLKITISAFKKVGFGNWFTSMTALGLLSFRTLTVGLIGNIEMQLASGPKNSALGKIFGWGRILADKMVKNFSQVGSKTNINEFVARGTGVSVDTSLYRKMAFEQGKQQIINILENTVSDVSTSNNSFIDNQAIIDSNQDLKKSVKMFGKLLQNLLPKDKELKKEDWANAFDKLLILMNEKDENGKYKLEQQNSKGYQFASTFLRGIFGSIPTATGKLISLSGDRVFFKYGYYQALVAYANSQGITNPQEVQRFIRLNSVPGTNADAMARRAGDRRIFQSDNKLVSGLAAMRSRIKQKEENLNAQIAVLKSQKRGIERFTRVYPAKMTRLGYKISATIISPFTRIPSNFINTAVQKTVFPVSMGDYLNKQFQLRELIKKYDELFDLDKNATISKTKQREMEAMRLEIFELQTRTRTALSSMLQALQVTAFGAMLLISGAASAPYGDDEDEKAKARAAGIAQQPSGTINITHFVEWMTGQADRYRLNKKGDIMFNYTNFGIVGFGLSQFMSLFQGVAAKEFEGKQVMGLGVDGVSNISMDLIFESLSNGITNLSFIQNVVALANAAKGQGNAVENLGVSLTKTILTVPTLSYGVFGAVERAEGITVDPMRNYMPELETDEGAASRFKARIITSLTGKSPLTWFGLKNEMGEFKSPYASPYYRAQIGPHGEELYKKNTFWDVRGGDWLAAYLWASFDPFSFHDYEGFVSTVRKFEVGQQYRKGDIVQGPSGVYAVLKDNKGIDLKDANKDPNDPEFKFIETKEKFFDKDRFLANQRGTEYSQTLFDLMNVYQQVTGDNKPFKVMSRLYDPYITAKDADGEFNVYIPEKYFRELAMARGEAARNSYSMEDIRSTLDRIVRVDDEDVFESDDEYKKFVKNEVENLLLGPADTNYNRDGGVQGLIAKAVENLESSETYRKIIRLSLIEGLKSEIFTEEQYMRMVRSEQLSPFIQGIPEEELKFKK